MFDHPRKFYQKQFRDLSIRKIDRMLGRKVRRKKWSKNIEQFCTMSDY